MHPIVETKRNAVAELCRQHGVCRLELFGSAARDDFDEASSDLDFLVVLDPDHPGNSLASYFDLKDQLETLFGRSVDLVSMGSVRNPYVQASIDLDRQIVYAA